MLLTHLILVIFSRWQCFNKFFVTKRWYVLCAMLLLIHMFFQHFFFHCIWCLLGRSNWQEKVQMPEMFKAVVKSEDPASSCEEAWGRSQVSLHSMWQTVPNASSTQWVHPQSMCPAALQPPAESQFLLIVQFRCPSEAFPLYWCWSAEVCFLCVHHSLGGSSQAPHEAASWPQAAQAACMSALPQGIPPQEDHQTAPK